MPRHFPLAAWVTLSASLVAAGAWVRFDGTFLLVDQLALGMLFLVAGLMLTAALICWLPLLRRLDDDRNAGRVVSAVVLCPAATMALLVGMAFETESAAAARHRDYLLRVARVVADDYDRRGRMPILLDDALRRDERGLPHRGDADGRALAYRRLDRRNALLCAPECRAHVRIRGSQVAYQPWPEGSPDPCQGGIRSGYWAGTTGVTR